MRQHSTCFHGGLGRKSRAAAGPPDSSRNLAIAVCRPWDCWGREPIPSGARRQFSDHACGLEERRSERAKSTRFSYILSRFFSFVLFFHQPFIFTHCCRSITLCIREWRRFDRLPGSLCLPTIPRRPVQTFAQLRTPAHRVLVPFFFVRDQFLKIPNFVGLVSLRRQRGRALSLLTAQHDNNHNRRRHGSPKHHHPVRRRQCPPCAVQFYVSAGDDRC